MTGGLRLRLRRTSVREGTMQVACARCDAAAPSDTESVPFVTQSPADDFPEVSTMTFRAAVVRNLVNSTFVLGVIIAASVAPLSTAASLPLTLRPAPFQGTPQGAESRPQDAAADLDRQLEEIRARMDAMQKRIVDQDRTIERLRAELERAESRAATMTDMGEVILELGRNLHERMKSLESRPQKGAYEVVFDRGIVLRPTDPAKTPFEMRINSRAQMRYTYFEPEADTWTDSAGKTRPILPFSAFEIERGRLTFSGYMLDQRWQYYLNFDFDTDDQHVVIAHDYWVDYIFADEFTLFFGKAFVPGSRDWLNGSTTTRFTDRSLATTFFRPDRSIGIWAEGTPVKDHVFYRVMVGNGFAASDLQPAQVDTKLTYSASVWTDPFGPWGRGYSDLEWHEDPAIRMGTSFTWSPQENLEGGGPTPEENIFRLSDGTRLVDPGALAPGVTVDKFNVTLWAADFALKWEGFSLNGEYFARWINSISGNGALPTTSLFDSGFYVEAGYMVIPKRVELNARTSQIWGDFGDNAEYAVGVNWFVDGTHNYKFTLDLTYLDSSNTTNSGTNYRAGELGWLVRAQLQVAF